MTNTPDLKRLFEPRGVAVIGASPHKEKIGFRVLQNILTGGYKGRVYPINPNEKSILGLKAYASVEETPEAVDVAVVIVPAPLVRGVVESCCRKRVPFIVVITSGFSEVGNNELETEIVELARSHGSRLLGPNVFGLFSAKAKLNATFGPSEVPHGNIAIVTQSGALGIAMMGKAAAERMGLSAVVSVGNKADLNENELLDYFEGDNATRVIFVYVEGFKDGEKLVRTLKRVTRNKHVVVLKAGKSRRGALAAASHTGSLAGSDAVFAGIAKQCGLVTVDSITDAFSIVRFLADAPLPNGENNVILTNGGGLGVLCADACEARGAPLMDDAATLKRVFADSGIVPSFGSTRNPVDLTGQADAATYDKALRRALAEKSIDCVMALYCETALFDADATLKGAAAAHAAFRGKKPVVFSLFGGAKINEVVDGLRCRGVPVFNGVSSAAAAVGALYSRYRYLNRPRLTEHHLTINESEIRRVVAGASAAGRSLLLPSEAAAILRAAGIAAPKSRVATSIRQAIKAAQEIGFPVVLKIVSEDIIHKTDAGGIILDLRDANEVADAYQAIVSRAKRHYPDARLAGIEVCELVARSGGVETIVGGTREQSFGPVVMFGLGGVYVETFKDSVFRSAPLTAQDGRDMVNEIKAAPLLFGARGEPKKDVDAVVDVLLRVSRVLCCCDEIADVELNPLLVKREGSGAAALDARIILKTKDADDEKKQGSGV